MGNASVSVEGLSMRFGRDASGTHALRDVSFDVERGEIFALVGPNGAGKSTIVLILATLLQPTAGRATIMGSEVTRDPAAVRRTIGVALQETGLDPRQPVRRLARLHCRLHGYSRSGSRERADATLALLGLGDVADRQIARLSGGMRRRLDLALALLHAPPVLLLDEPTTGLDPHSRRALWQEIARLRDEGAAIVLTTQQLVEAEELADRVAIVNDGRIVVEGSPAALKHQMPHAVLDTMFATDADAVTAAALLGGDVSVLGPSVRARLSNDPAAVSRAIARLDAHGLQMSALAVHEPTLEDVLIAHTARGDDDG
jgi:ABC-2 type transport system ATP-binding protein